MDNNKFHDNSPQLAISVDNVSKNFLLPHERVNSVKGLFTGLAQNLNRTKETQHALRNISLQINKGEFFGIVGRNGSGKSTLLKILAGIYQPTTGSVQTHGKLVPFIELGVGFNTELTGRENVFLNGAMLGFSRKEVEKMYESIVEFAELERFMDQKLKNYSSGMQVRLAFSMATRAEADILLVDEVLAVGDADFQSKCFDYFRKLKRDRKTVVFVSHDMSAVREYCDRAVLIEDSKIINAGPSEDIAQEYIKLFSAPLPSENQDSSKWGEGGADIKKIETSKKIYTENDDLIEIKVAIKALDNFEEGIVPGITIKTDAGQAICGTNGKILRLPNLKLSKGKSATVTWTVPNVFSEGQFIIEPALSDAGNMKVLQWWSDARTFRVLNKYKTPYPVSPKMTFKTSEE